MKRSALAILSLFVVSLSASAQMAPPKPQYFYVHEELVRPSMMMQYETAGREWVSALIDKKADPKILTINSYLTTDFRYIYIAPIANWAGIDSFQSEFMAVGKSVGPKWTDFMNRSNSAMYSYDEYVIALRPDLSYAPANSRMKPEEERFFHLMYYYVDPARVEQAEQTAKEYVALFKAKNVATRFTIFQAMSGTDLPLYVVSVPGKSAADFYANDEQVNAALGNDVKALFMKSMSTTRKFEVRDAVSRPDLSYPGPAAPK